MSDLNKDDSDEESGSKFSLSSILFGNLDSNGELIDDFLGKETTKHLKSLDQLNIASNLIEEIKDDFESPQNDKSEEETVTKLESAVDYSDINEMVDDTQEDDLKFQEALSELVFKMPTAPISKPAKKKIEEDDDYDSSESEKSPEKNAEKKKETKIDINSVNEKIIKKDFLETDESKLSNKKKLDTPLAAMLPLKYEDCDVTEIFPEFRPNKTLRFSRLFGPGKASLMPNLWKNLKNKKKKKKRQLSETNKEDDKVSKKDEFDLDTEIDQKIFLLKFADAFNENDVESDQEEYLKKELECKNYSDLEENLNSETTPKVADWRHGPAKLWYDMIGIPEAGKNFDYGFKVKERMEEPDRDSLEEGEIIDDNASNLSTEDCYHMVTQMHWEDEIVWNGEDCKQKILSKNTEKYHSAGWIPSGQNRTACSFIKQVRGLTLPTLGPKPVSNPINALSSSKKDKNKSEINSIDTDKDETWYSMFPAENEELIYGIWEEDVIWDAESVEKLPDPKILTLDPNDENIVLGIPDDIDPNAVKPKEVIPIPLKEKKEHHLKKSRILLGKAGVIAEPEPESPPPPEELEKDPFNISNDEYYNPKLVQNTALKPTVGLNLIQHSIPALELRPIFFPTFISQVKLRSFHRPPLKRYSHGAIADSLSHPVIPLLKYMKKKAKLREQERLAAGGGDMFFMRTPEDLSGKDGDLILCEFSEEHPPLMMQVGMATKIKNYYKRRLGKDAGAPDYEFGETVYAHTTPFLGNLMPGQSLQALENSLFRAPIYKHRFPETDFLIIRTRNNYFVRTIDIIFTVGQELPLYEVPGPNSKKANNFIRDFLQVFIYRLFWSSTDSPRRIKMEDIKKAFPSHSESSIRKRLKLCADFKRTGMDSNWWVLKPEFRLPTEEEMRAMVSPEQCCAYYSMIAAEQRLKDAGYGEKTLFTADDDNDEDQQLKMDDEVKTAPWNTTRAFIAAMKGKCLLQLNGVADPTGCGEGFSYIRIPNKPQISKEDNIKQQEPKKTVTGTDADLRRLSLSAAKNLLRKHNVPEEEIKKLSRWEVIDVVRTLSTAQAKAGAETMSKFARGNRFSIAEHQERYKEEAQRIFELQNKLLGSIEELSTDEDESEEEDMDIEEMGKNIENIIANKKTSQQLTLEKEEEERKELRKLLMGEESNQGDEKNKSKKPVQANKQEEEADNSMNMSNQGKLLKIYRTYRNADGKEYIRIETVRKPGVITAYVKFKQTKDAEQIRKFAFALDDQQKEEYRKVKRRIQEQLRRLKRNAEKNQILKAKEVKTSLSDEPQGDSLYEDPSVSAKPIGESKKKDKKESKVKCGNCGNTGHMKTNRICPLYSGELPPIPVAMTEKEEQEQKTTIERDDLIKVDDTKLIFSKTLLNYEEEIRKKALILKVPKDLMKRKRRGAEDYCDYLEKPDYKQANRRRKDPLVSLSIILEEIVTEIKQMEGTDVFWLPVNSKKVKDYYNIISKPMDIQTIKKKVSEKAFKSRDEFIQDWLQIHENSKLYNGVNNILTSIAQKMLDLAQTRIQEKSDKIAVLERTINPLLDNDQVAFSYILECIILQKLKIIPESWPFHKPVNKKVIKNYYDVIKNPIDLESILSNVKEHKYHSRQQFLNDIELMYKNCATFNGPDSPLTKKALEILNVAKQCITENDEKLKELENSIVATKEALEGDDSESVITGGLSNPELDENSSLAEADYRPESRAESTKNEFYGDNQSDFYDENSQSGLVINHEDNQRTSQENQMMLENNENDDIVDENYDPSEFLFEKFKQPVVMSEDDDEEEEKKNQFEKDKSIEQSTSNYEQDFSISDSDDSKMEIDNQAKNDEEQNEDDDDIWF